MFQDVKQEEIVTINLLTVNLKEKRKRKKEKGKRKRKIYNNDFIFFL